MGFFDKAKELVGIEDSVDQISEAEIREAEEKLAREEKREQRPSSYTPSPVRSEVRTQIPQPSSPRYTMSTSTNPLKGILTFEPQSFEDCQKLVDTLKQRKAIIINLEKVETDTAEKIFYFMNGATAALNGNVQTVANNIFLFTPEKVEVRNDVDRTPAPAR